MKKPIEQSTEKIVDLKSVVIDTSEPTDKRVAQFHDKFGKPCVFRVGKITINVESNSDRSLLDALVSAYTQEDVYDY